MRLSQTNQHYFRLDGGHNHAVVCCLGQNRSLFLNLTKLKDFHLGSVTESTLWRSTDCDSTYERMNDKVGSKTVLSYLYVCPSNKRKIVVLTDPEFESSVLVSSDEGASYQKYLPQLLHPNPSAPSNTGGLGSRLQPRPEGIQYVTCQAPTCSEYNRNYPFPEYIDISSLVVQDDYMFIQDNVSDKSKRPKTTAPQMERSSGQAP
uniref:VPS10 domain-containing receptor SorCS1-like n=1 Tax=Oncorhynchus gorbuscha TaxID=8017 RepID=UPI001EAF4616|nr:VPS10 domain-containing receptor SorCS1-like [Oncorhynchus gorbuscha]